MGIPLFSRAEWEPSWSPPAGNPSPYNWVLVKEQRVLNGVVLLLRYPDARNHEGLKILVFKGPRSYESIRAYNKGAIDPHFDDNSKYYLPVARFDPHEWEMAVNFARSM
jgi:hypothetical protein